MERAFDGGLESLNAARKAHGLSPLEHALDQVRSHQTLVLVEPTFDFPANLPPNVRFAGAQLDDPGWTEGSVPPAGDDPLVLVDRAPNATVVANFRHLRRPTPAARSHQRRAAVWTTAPPAATTADEPGASG